MSCLTRELIQQLWAEEFFIGVADFAYLEFSLVGDSIPPFGMTRRYTPTDTIAGYELKSFSREVMVSLC